MAASARVSFIVLYGTPIRQRRKGNFGVVEGNGAIGEDLLFFVALAGDEDDVVRLGFSECEVDGRGAIGLDGIADIAGFEAGLDFSEDGARIFGARVVAGGDDEVASLPCGQAHLGAFGAIAIAAAAEDSEDAATGLRGHLARKSSEIAERVVGVRVVDDDGEGLAGVDGLEAAGDWHGAAGRMR